MSSRRAFLVALLVLVGLGLGISLLSRRGPSAPEGDGEREGDERTTAPRAVSPPRLEGVATDAAVEGTTPPSPGPTAPGKETAETGRRGASVPSRVRGTLHYEDGAVPKTFSFTLVRATGPGRGSGWTVEGRAGAFVGPAIPDGVYEIRKVIADGEAHLAPEGSVPVVRGEALAITIPFGGGHATLLVLDAETSRALPDAVAVRDRGHWILGGAVAPDPAVLPTARSRAQVPLHADPGGRIALPRAGETHRYFVHAPGYAWRWLSVAPTNSASIPVGLAPGGTVVLHVPGWSALERRALYVDRRELAPGARVRLGDTPEADAEGTIRIEGLPVGLVSFAVGQQVGPFSGRVLAAERSEILQGRETHIGLHFDAPPGIRRAAVAGTLRVPEAWGRQTQAWRVFLTGISDDPATQGQHSAARVTPTSRAFSMTFETDPLIEGPYALVLQPLGWKCRVEVTEGMEPLTLDVPVPVEVRIRVTDANGGGDLPEAEVRYSPTMEGEPGWVWRPTTFDERTAEHVCRCPAGRSQFDARMAGYMGWSDTREIPAVDVERILVELCRGGAIRVLFRAEGELLPARGIRVWFSSEREGRSGQSGADAVFLDGIAPGSWTVKPKPLAGYRLPAPRTVDVKAGETVEVVFDLEPEPE